MATYVYIDMLFLLNFCVNLVIIAAAGRLCGVLGKFWRKVLGAVLAAALYILFFALGGTVFLNILSLLSGISGGLFVGYAPVKRAVMGRLFLTALVLTITLGGGSLAAYHALNMTGAFPVWLLGFSVLFVYFAVKFIFERIERRRRSAMLRTAYANVTVSLHGKEARLTALIDTGHTLTEPISKKPVIIAEFAALRPILPDPAADLFAKQEDVDPALAATAFVEAGLAERFHLVPYRSIGEKSGLLIGLRADGVVVDGNPLEAVTCVYNGRMSDESEYNALVGAGAIHEAEADRND